MENEPQIDIFWRSLSVNLKFQIWVKLSTICPMIIAATYSQSNALITEWDDDMNTEEDWFDNYLIIIPLFVIISIIML